ncbi:MAG: hypothetical protein GY765_42185 [bacterium]|nr:hypothetical protein [bacterium]
MKKKSKTQKLALNKQTVSRLSGTEMSSQRGGVDAAAVIVPLAEPEPTPWQVISVVDTVISLVITIPEIPVSVVIG